MVKNKVIKSVSGNQFEILKNIMLLHNHGDGFDCDITYSTGGFYGRHNLTDENGEKSSIEIPEPIYKFDVDPQTPDTETIDPWG
ncbi:MAG: hypothetical protein LUD72_03085 [Bacteroidales bacterium]|nr:hypothetical protein [Bacteroidales bacterium]